MLPQRPQIMILCLLLSTQIVSVDRVVADEEQWRDKIKVSISPGKAEFLIGEPIFMEVILTNNHDGIAVLPDTLHRNFQFSVNTEAGGLVKHLKDPDISGLYRMLPIPPGGSATYRVFISEYLGFPGPGIYAVTYRGDIPISRKVEGAIGSDRQALPASGAVSIQLRQGSDQEILLILKEYLKQLNSADRRLQSQAGYALALSKPTLVPFPVS